MDRPVGLGQQVRGHAAQQTMLTSIVVWSSISPAMVKNSAFVFIKPGLKDYLWFIVLPGIPICALAVYDSE